MLTSTTSHKASVLYDCLRVSDVISLLGGYYLICTSRHVDVVCRSGHELRTIDQRTVKLKRLDFPKGLFTGISKISKLELLRATESYRKKIIAIGA